MKILLTGRCGQLGSYLAPLLAPIGGLKATDRAELDLADSASLLRELEAFAPDLIVNAAAHTDVDGAEINSAPAHAINATAPSIIAQWASSNDAAMIHFSTDYVFAGVGETPHREDDQTRPINAYGASKLAGENAIRAAGCPHLILRTAWLYSARGQNFFRTILRLAAERETLRVVNDQTGAPTAASWLARAVAEIVSKADKPLSNSFKSNGGTINATCAGVVSWYGFATAIVERARARGFPCKVEKLEPISSAEYLATATRPQNSRLDLTRLKRDWGIVPIDWQTALDEVFTEMTNSGD